MKNTICGTGHRPQHVSNFGTAKDDIKKFISENNVGKVISGMALGYDTILAEAVIELKEQGAELILEAAVPCNNQDCKWLEKDRIKYKNILSKCDTVTLLQQEYTADCLQNRNKYMVDNSDIILAYWNGKQNGGTYNCIKYAESKHKKIINIYKEEKTMKRTLQCHSKGDKRFSALYAQVEINGVVDTIERWYQGCKRDIHGECVGKGQPVDHIIWKGVERPASDLTPLYEWLWRQYFTQNPQLLVEAAGYDEFVDIFKGKSINCQADIIKKLVIEYKKNKEEEKKMKNTQIIKSNAHLYNACIDKKKRDFSKNYVFQLRLEDYKDLPSVDSVIENLRICKNLIEEGLNIVLQGKDGKYGYINDGIKALNHYKKQLTYVMVYPITIGQLAYYASIGCKNISIDNVALTGYNNYNYLSIIDSYNCTLYYNNKPLSIKLLESRSAFMIPEDGIIEIPVGHNSYGSPDFKTVAQIVLSIRAFVCDKTTSTFTKADVYDKEIGNVYYSSIAEKENLLAEKYTEVEYFVYNLKECYSNIKINLTGLNKKDINIFLKGWLIDKYNGEKGYISHTSPVLNKMKGIKFIFNGDASKVYVYTKKNRTDLTPIFDIDIDVQDMIHRVLEYGYYLSDILIDPMAVIHDTLDCLRKIPEQYAKTRKFIRDNLSKDPQRILNMCFDYLSEIPEVDAYKYIDMNVLMELNNEAKEYSDIETEDVKVIKYGDYNLLEAAINKGEIIEKK